MPLARVDVRISSRALLRDFKSPKAAFISLSFHRRRSSIAPPTRLTHPKSGYPHPAPSPPRPPQRTENTHRQHHQRREPPSRARVGYTPQQADKRIYRTLFALTNTDGIERRIAALHGDFRRPRFPIPDCAIAFLHPAKRHTLAKLIK